MSAEKRSAFWLLYLFYGAEAFHTAFLASGFVVKGFYDISPGALLFFILPAPVLIGFWTRHYFVRGIWIAYAWIVGLGYASSDVAGDVLSIDWGEEWLFLIYPVILTLVLTMHKTSGSYFFRTMFAGQPQENEEPEAEEEQVFQKGQKLDPDAFLAMRLAKGEQQKQSTNRASLGWAQAFWTGGYIGVAGYLLGVSLIWEFGLMILVMGFVFGRIWLQAARRGD